MDEEFMKLGEVAARLRVSRSLAYRLAQRKQIPAVRFGEAVRVPRAAFDKWLDAQIAEPVAEATA